MNSVGFDFFCYVSLNVSIVIPCIFEQLNVLELFLDCITEPNEKLVEFGIGGICNSCAGIFASPF